MISSRAIFTAVLLAAMLAGGLVFAEKVEKLPGYFDLEWIQIPDDADEVQDINLQAALKGLSADAEDSGDDELAQLLGLIKSVRVKGYSLDEHTAKDAEKSVQNFRDMLEDKGWDQMIHVKDHDEIVTVSTKSVDGKMVGVTAVIFEPGDEVVFVNVVGDLDLGTLLSLANNFDEDDLEEVLGEFKEYDDD